MTFTDHIFRHCSFPKSPLPCYHSQIFCFVWICLNSIVCFELAVFIAIILLIENTVCYVTGSWRIHLRMCQYVHADLFQFQFCWEVCKHFLIIPLLCKLIIGLTILLVHHLRVHKLGLIWHFVHLFNNIKIHERPYEKLKHPIKQYIIHYPRV